MEPLQQTTQKIVELMGFKDISVSFDAAGRRISILINDGEWIKEWLPKMISDFSHIVRLLGKKNNISENIYIDVNNYRKERERIILELARAAARKATTTKEEIKLPAMNAYERRLIHTELSARPDVKTESIGEKLERYVIIKPLL
ncbi:MAG: R3H domain-containing nucleic acid-binding protein [Nanoarchaeota archaeon]